MEGETLALVTLVTLVGKACGHGVLSLCVPRMEAAGPGTIQNPLEMPPASIPALLSSTQGRKVSLPPLTAVKKENKPACSYRNPGFIFLFSFMLPCFCKYHCSFLEGNLKEGGTVAIFFLCWYPPIRRNTEDREGTDKGRRIIERKAAQMPVVPGLEKRNAVGKSSSVSTEVGLSSPGVSRPLCHCW